MFESQLFPNVDAIRESHPTSPSQGEWTYRPPEQNKLQSAAMRKLFCWLQLMTIGAGVVLGAVPRTAPPRPVVLDNVRVIDGSGDTPIERGRIVIQDDRIAGVGPGDRVTAPAEADRIDLAGRTVVPGLIDLHFHIENDPRLALRQLSHGVTAFRDPGQWDEKFVELRRLIAADHLPGPRIFTTGPHIDGDHPAYPADSVVARDPEEARRAAELSIQRGASAIKIYFRLPFASARAVIDVCEARHVPCTAHLEILDARELIAAGLNGIEHVTSLGTSVVPRITAEGYRQAVLADNEARRDGRYKLFAAADLDGPEAQALYAVIGARKPWLDPTLAVFERRLDRPEKGATPESVRVMAAGFARMQQLTRRAGLAGARLVMGGHSTVPFAARGEAPWRELELLVESGLSPLEAITAATGTAAAFLYRGDQLGKVRRDFQADLVVLRDNPLRSISAIRSVERVMVGGKWVDVDPYRTY
jgi:imidazolonepropionase-like amidohydrolase